MRNVYEVLSDRERAVKQVRNEIEALRIVAALLSDGTEFDCILPTAVNGPVAAMSQEVDPAPTPSGGPPARGTANSTKVLAAVRRSLGRKRTSRERRNMEHRLPGSANKCAGPPAQDIIAISSTT